MTGFLGCDSGQDREGVSFALVLFERAGNEVAGGEFERVVEIRFELGEFTREHSVGRVVEDGLDALELGCVNQALRATRSAEEQCEMDAAGQCSFNTRFEGIGASLRRFGTVVATAPLR